MHKKNVALFSAALVAALLLTACGSSADNGGSVSSESSGSSETSSQTTAESTGSTSESVAAATDGGEVYTLKLGTDVSADDPLQTGLEQMRDNVAERTDGHVIIEIYPNCSLGDTDTLVEQIVAGANVGTIPDAGTLSNYESGIGILNGPYLFNNYEECEKVVESDLFQSWSDSIAEQGIRVLTCNYFQGERNVVSKKLVESPEDMKGMLIRTIGTPLYEATFKALGASPQTMAWSEVYNALQTKVVDACEAQYPAIIGSNLTEVAPYIAKTEHLYMLTGVAVSEDWYEQLPEEYQQILVEEAMSGGQTASQLVIDNKENFEKQLTDSGATITEVDKEEFAALTDSAYDAVEGYRDLKNQIDEMLGH